MGNYFRAWGIVMWLGVFPLIGFTQESVESAASKNHVPVGLFQDDKDKKQEDKGKDQKRPEVDKEKEPKQKPKVADVEPKRPNIKEVPRARPKLRPGTVTDRVKVKRPPVRVKPGRVLH